MKQLPKRFSELWISALGLAAVSGAFLQWWGQNPDRALPGLLAALVSLLLYVAVCLRFVPDWMAAWRLSPPLPDRRLRQRTAEGAEPLHMEWKIFAALLALNGGVLLLVYRVWLAVGHQGSFKEYLEFWRCLDSGHYLDISRDWYFSDGIWDRVVQLVFLPGYPVLVRLFTVPLRYDLYAGLTVSILAFSGAGAALYRLLRLDYPHATALRAVRYLCLLPGVFFFTAPMSDGLFLLLCCLCLYCVRKGHWFTGCLLGGYAAFTRSLGLTLLVPLVFEAVEQLQSRQWAGKQGFSVTLKQALRRILPMLLIPAGFGVYCYICWKVSGNPFQFMIYQRDHWYQRLGWFFNTAAYQTEYALRSFGDNRHTFYGLWLPNLVFGFGVLALLLFTQKKLRPGYVAWFLVYYFIAYGATWLLSGPRYMIGLIPVPLACALLTEDKDADAILSLSLLALAFLYLIFFVRRWQVF